MNAKTTESSNLPHGRCDELLQKCKSFEYKTTIPADEHAAASDKVAVTQSPTTKRLTKTGL